MKKLFLILITLLAVTNVFGVTKVKLAEVTSYIYSEEEYLEPFREEIPGFDTEAFIALMRLQPNVKYSDTVIYAVNKEHWDALTETAYDNPDCFISASFEAGYADILIFHNNKYHFFRMTEE